VLLAALSKRSLREHASIKVSKATRSSSSDGLKTV